MKHLSWARTVCWRTQKPSVMRIPGSRVFDNDGNVIYPEEAVPVTGAEESEEQPVLDEQEEKEPDVEEQPKTDDLAEEKAEADVDETEFPTAEELPATIAYGKLKTLMNIRKNRIPVRDRDGL